MGRQFLGLDVGTQGLTAVWIDKDARRILARQYVDYDRDLPSFGTTHGVLPGRDQRIVHAPPLLWVAALDRVFHLLRKDGLPLDEILALSGAAQQHGTVYLSGKAGRRLGALDSARPPDEQAGDILARPSAPVWMDTSTETQCEEIRQALGGSEAAARMTGSDLTERFAGPQIRKFHQEDPAAYAATAQVALVSSFMASWCIGRTAPLDYGDGSGTNLMDLQGRSWHPAALDATAPGLAGKLPPLAPPDTVLGTLHRYWVERHGFDPRTEVVLWTGDNPASLVGTGLTAPVLRAISLGTSDTCFGPLGSFRTDPAARGHVFGSPTGGFMALLCFRNGSLARERVRDRFGLDWDGFSEALRASPPGNRGALMLPWFEPEIVPRVTRAGERRRGLPPDDAAAHCRAVVEAQMMAMRRHVAWMGTEVSCLVATGGASRNRAILQVMADVHGCPVVRSEIPDSAALGAALGAAHAWQVRRGAAEPWTETVSGFTDPVPGSEIRPQAGTERVYEALASRQAAFEREALAE